MLRLAVQAGIPVITCTTNDTINLGSVLNFICDGNLAKWNGKLTEDTVYYCLGDPEPKISGATYSKLVDTGCVVIVVNPTDPLDVAFHAGEVPVPKELVAHLLTKVVPNDKVPLFHRAVSGLTLKQVGEIVRLTQCQYGVLEPRRLMQTRAMLAGKMPGLAQVDIQHGYYEPTPQLEEWCEGNKKLFLNPPDERLTPRGIMLVGAPGVGKTQGAKYIASKFGVPLYRLDMASSLGRYVGESEGNLSRALSIIDQEEPCVLLIDEIEKIFAEKEDSGVTSRLLAQLLWWLQEHTSHVLTVMTSNDKDKLPPELYRAGRIDRVIELSMLTGHKLKDFAINVIGQWVGTTEEKKGASAIYKRVAGKVTYFDTQSFSHAQIVEMVKDAIKEGFDK